MFPLQVTKLNCRISSLYATHDAKDPLPCSLVMTFPPDGRVIAHVQLLAVVGHPQAVYFRDGNHTLPSFPLAIGLLLCVHAVLVSPDFRGHGLGRRIMEEAERYASDHELHTMHLFTSEREDFYTHLGYQRGPTICPQRSSVANLGFQQVSGCYSTYTVKPPIKDLRPNKDTIALNVTFIVNGYSFYSF